MIVLRLEGDLIQPKVITESLAHLRADQLLTSSLFGLLGTREPTVREELSNIGKRHDDLFLNANRTPQEEAEFQELKARIIEQTPTGESSAARYVEEAVRQAVQQLAVTPAPIMPAGPLPASNEIKEAIQSKIKDLLSDCERV